MAVVVEEMIELLGEELLGGAVEEELLGGVVEEELMDGAVEEELLGGAVEEELVVVEETGGASLGARIGAVLGARIQTALTGVLGLLKKLGKETLKLVMLQMALDDLPEKYKKKLAGMIQKLADAAKKLLKTSDKYVELSGGSKEGKKLAKETQGIVDHLHEHVRKLTEDSPSKVQLSKEKQESMMEAARKQEELNEKKLQQLTRILGELDGVLDEDGQINMPEGESRVQT